MRFTVTATTPLTGRVEIVDVDAADFRAAEALVAADGRVVQRVELAAEERTVLPVRQVARREATQASFLANLIGGVGGGIGLFLSTVLTIVKPQAGVILATVTIGPAIVLLFVSYHARRLRFWALIALLTMASLLAAGTCRLAIEVLDEPIPMLVLMIVLSLALVIVYRCAQSLRFLSTIREGRVKGFAVEPIEAHGIMMVSRGEEVVASREAGRSSERPDS